MFSYQNIIDANGVSISLTGMFIVFSGLIFMSLYIYFLPRILGVFEKTPYETKSSSPTAEDSAKDKAAAAARAEADELEAHDIASVIGIVLHLELEKSQLIDDQRITIVRDAYHAPVWGISRKLRVTPSRRS